MPSSKVTLLSFEDERDTTTTRKPGKAFVPIIFVVGLVVGSLMSVWVIRYLKPRTDVGLSDTCNNPDCEALSKFMLANMNKSVDPCEDFHGYACGNFSKEGYQWTRWIVNYKDITKDPILRAIPRLISEGKGGEPIQKIGTFFNSCLDNAASEKRGVEPFKALLTDILGGVEFDPKTWDLKKALHKTANEYTLGGLIEWVHGWTNDDTGKTVPQIELSGISPGLLGSDVPPEIRAYYVEFAIQLGASDSSAHRLVDAAAEFGTILQDAMRWRGEEAELSTNLEEFIRAVPFIDWQHLINSAFAMINSSVPDSLLIYTQHSYQFKAACESIANMSKFEAGQHMLHSTMKIRLMDAFKFALPRSIQELEALEGRGTRTLNFCVKAVISSRNSGKPLYRGSLTPFENFILHLVVDDAFPRESHDQMRRLFDTMKKNLKEMVEEIPWLDSESKKAAILKIEELRVRMAFGESFYGADSRDDDAYRSLKGLTHENYLANLLLVSKWAKMNELRYIKSGKRPILDQFDLDRELRRVHALSDGKEISVTFDYLNFPTYSRRFPKAVNYGSIGTAFAQNLLLALQKSAAGEGQRGGWLSQSSREKLEAEKKCFAENYGDMLQMLEPEEMMINLFRDQGSLLLSLRIFEKVKDDRGQLLPFLGLTAMQQFFVRDSQTNCATTRKARMNPILYNNPAFMKAFSCPSKKPICRTWQKA